MGRLAERAALREDAASLLDELGETANEVAMSLYLMGLQARPSSVGDSPVPRYLHAVVGADTRVKRVRVTKRWLVLKTHRRWWSTIWLRLPYPVRECIASVERTRPSEATGIPFEGNQA